MKETNDGQNLDLELCKELGIVELDARLDLAFDPLSTILAAVPTNGNCHGCNAKCGVKLN